MAVTEFSPALGTMSARRPGVRGSALTSVDEELDLSKRNDGHVDLEITNKSYDDKNWTSFTLDSVDMVALATFLAHQMDDVAFEGFLGTLQGMR